MLFLGHFHPLLVHLPIGGLALLGVLELVACFTRWKDAAQNNQWVLTFICATAGISAICGWLLATGGGYDAELLRWHRALGLALALGCLVSLLLLSRDMLRAYRVSLIASLALLGVTSHLGGTLTHGRGFLTGHAPAALQPVAGYAMSRPGAEALPAMQRPVFAALVLPILQERCVSCHNSEKHKAELRLDTLTELLKGGQNGPVIHVGHARDSSLLQRMLLSPDADGHMPPEGQSEPSAAEIAVIEWWINAGAPGDERIADLKLDARTRRIVSTVLGRQEPGKVLAVPDPN